MLNKDDDGLFPAEEVRVLFDAVTAKSKVLRFFPGGHDDWTPELLDTSARFLAEAAGSRDDRLI